MTKPQALIVEDDLQLRHIFMITLAGEFQVATVSDGHEAINYLAQHTPRLIVLDLNLPVSSGQDILENVRADSRFAQTRIVICSADERRADALRSEADLVLLKPVSPTQLRELALRLMSKPINS